VKTEMQREYEQLCRIDENPGVQGLAQLGRNAINRVSRLESQLASADARTAELESALLVERERICAAIKATDDAASACDYMLDSDDCIAVVRGELGPANYEDAARAGNGDKS